MRMRWILPMLLAVTASAAFASHEAGLYVVPVAGHTHGAAGSLWTTDLTIHNPGAAPIAVTIHLIESGLPADASLSVVAVDGDSSVMVGAGETRTIRDVLATHEEGAGVTGALIVEGDAPFALTSRTSTRGPGPGAVGASIPPVSALFDSSPAGADDTAVLPGIIVDDGSRMNVGLLVASLGASLTIEVTLLDAMGSPVGERTIAVPGEGFAHLQFPLFDVLPAFTDGTAVVRIAEGDGLVVPYAAVVDGHSGDPAVVTGGIVSSSTGVSAAAALRDLISK